MQDRAQTPKFSVTVLWKAFGLQARSTELIPPCLTPTGQTHPLWKKGKTKIKEQSLTRNNIINTAMFTHGKPFMDSFTSYKEGSNLTLTLGGS